MAERDLVSFFYPAAKASRAETIRAIHALLGLPGVAVFEAMERADPKERGRIASIVQTELRKLAKHRIEPVLPRSAAKPAQPQPSSGTRRR
jgi:hypothetical protein